MAQGRYVEYRRVSTGKQGRSGLGLEAQAETVRTRLNGGNWIVIASFTEVESGRVSHRPELAKALAYCRIMDARLIVANVSRLTRDPDFMSTLVQAEVEVEFCDLPNTDGPVGKFMLRQMLSVAELEAGMIAERTKKALAAAKARGVKLGGDRGNLHKDNEAGRTVSLEVRRAKATRRSRDLAALIDEIRTGGVVSLNGIARVLTERGVPTPRGGATWAPVQVGRVIANLARV